jgi:hypothetical protein
VAAVIGAGCLNGATDCPSFHGRRRRPRRSWRSNWLPEEDEEDAEDQMMVVVFGGENGEDQMMVVVFGGEVSAGGTAGRGMTPTSSGKVLD